MSKLIACIIAGFSLIMSMSCKTSTASTKESPLAVVVKLISAEELGDFEAAKKYLDVAKAYPSIDTISAENRWRDMVNFSNALSKDKKFTNIFKYYNYVIQEQLSNDKADVIFEAIDSEETVRKIIYHLSSVKKEWIVIKIDYVSR